METRLSEAEILRIKNNIGVQWFVWCAAGDGIYLPGVGGIRHSDTVLVTNKGYESLTRYPVDLDALMIRGWKVGTRIKGQLVRRALRLADKRHDTRP